MTHTQKPAQYRCRCHALSDAAEDPNVPIKFDPVLNEYHIERRHDDGYMLIHFCPSCGGRPPSSRRDRQFARVRFDEHRRLMELMKDVRTPDDAIRIFGEPDSDLPQGHAQISPGTDARPPVTEGFRTLVYRGLSDTADVHIIDTMRDRVHVMLLGKHLGARAGEMADDRETDTLSSTGKTQKEPDAPTCYCTFCGKSNDEVAKMVAGQHAFICNECVLMLLAVVED